MSSEGWQEFLAGAGVADWVVLHGGAMAVFRVPSLAEAVRLAEAVAHVPGLDGAAALMTIAGDQLTVRLTRDIWQLEQRHVHLARAVSAVARAHGGVAGRARAGGTARHRGAARYGRCRLLARCPWVRGGGRRQRRRPARPRIDGLDAGP